MVTAVDTDEVNNLAAYLTAGQIEVIAVLGKDVTCLIPIDGKDPRTTGTARAGAVFTNGKPNTLVYNIFEDALDISVDDKSVLEWDEFSRLNPRTGTQPFSLGGGGATFRFDRIALIPLEE